MEISRPLLRPPGWPLWHWIETRLARRAAPDADDSDELAGLDARTLRDIGASPRLLACAEAHCAARREERDALRLGAAAAGWRHW